MQPERNWLYYFQKAIQPLSQNTARNKTGYFKPLQINDLQKHSQKQARFSQRENNTARIPPYVNRGDLAVFLFWTDRIQTQRSKNNKPTPTNQREK